MVTDIMENRDYRGRVVGFDESFLQVILSLAEKFDLIKEFVKGFFMIHDCLSLRGMYVRV